MTHSIWFTRIVVVCALWVGTAAEAAGAEVTGSVRDETGAPLPGARVELRIGEAVRSTITTGGGYEFDGVPAGDVELTFSLVNFGTARREITVGAGLVRVDVVLQLVLSADVVVTGMRTFTNLADAANPAANLVGVAQSASQGAVTAAQVQSRPLLRGGEVLEAVPGVIISQHSGEGKANQYYLRGFNLDHGTDFATTVAGVPVNLPTHGHGHGYADLAFLIPELVSGVQYSKGPYFAEQGDFATAGAATINYTSSLERPLLHLATGEDGYRRALAAASPLAGDGRMLAALEAAHNDGPWSKPDDYRKLNGLLRYSRGDGLNGISITAMGYDATWSSTDQIPRRAVRSGTVGRFGALDESDGGDTYRYSAAAEWQRSRGTGSTRVTAFGFAYGLDLYSNFTYFLDDPENGDQFHQVDRRIVMGGRVTHRRDGRWWSRVVRNTFGVQFRNDDIGAVGLHRTRERRRLSTIRDDQVLQTSAGAFYQNELEWRPWVRTLAGVRVDGYRFDVSAAREENSGVETAGIVSPKGAAVLGPWRGTELYVNAGLGFHSNDARGATIAVDPATGAPTDRVTPLARATGIEAGLRTVAIPGLQTTVTVWRLALASELVFVGDAGTTQAGRPSRRDGIEIANYFSPRRWLTMDADLAWSRSIFADDDPAGRHIPGAIQTVVSGGVTVEDAGRVFGSMRLRYFGPRPLVEDNTVRSAAATIASGNLGYKLSPRIRVSLDVFNLLNAAESDVDYFYTSRLPGEPEGGIDDVHFHPAIPRTVRVAVGVSF